jgi:hypothetical protein
MRIFPAGATGVIGLRLAALLVAAGKGAGVYNVAEDDGAVSSARAMRDLGFDPAFRVPQPLAEKLRAIQSAPAR